MKARYFFVILAFGALSTNSGFADNLVTPGNGAPESGAGAAIDTRVPVFQGRQVRNSKDIKEIIRGLQERLLHKSKTAITPATDPLHFQQTSPLGADGAPVRNAVGAIADQRIAVPRNGAAAPSDPTRQGAPAIGAQVSGERGPPTGSTGDTAKPLNGTVAGGIANASQGGSNHPPKTNALAIAATNGPAVSGSGMMRPGFGSGAVGGPPKVAAGAINGSSFRPKHP